MLQGGSEGGVIQAHGSLKRASQENRLERQLQQLTYPKVLALDEIGYLLMTLTSNKSLVDWGDIFGDAVLATAILDHLLHYSMTINIKGESYRLKSKHKAGIPSAPVKEEEGKAATGWPPTLEADYQSPAFTP